VACAGLCSWVIALEKYDKVIKEVEPKRQKLREAEAQLEVSGEGARWRCARVCTPSIARLQFLVFRLTLLATSLQHVSLPALYIVLVSTVLLCSPPPPPFLFSPHPHPHRW
jgi:hypothetical protein